MMIRLRLDWTWKLESVLHCGSGESRPGLADRLVQRDASGNPFIPGDAVRGVLRTSAEHVAAWLGVSQKSRYGDAESAPWEPEALPLALLFGRGRSHVSPATIAPNCRVSPMVISATAINKATGTAKSDTLRAVEAVSGDIQMDAWCEVVVPDQHVDVVETLLVASLAASEQIAAKAGIGWGRVTVANCGLRRDGEAVHAPLAAVSADRLESLATALESTLPPDGEPVPVLPEEASGYAWFELDFTLHEPACLPAHQEIANQVTTEQAPSATTIRGALQRHWRDRNEPEVVASFLSERTVWSPAFPIMGATVFAPTAITFQMPKGVADMAGGEHVFDTLAGEKPPKDADNRPIPLRSISSPWIAKDQTGLVVFTVPRETRMHIARDYWSGSKRQTALFSRESLVPQGTGFRAWACLPVTAFAATECADVYLGKRTSAGNGRASLRVRRLDAPPTPFPSAAPARAADVFVELVSAAIVLDDADGCPRGGIDGDWWLRLAGVEALNPKPKVEARVAHTRRGGWMRSWNHQRAAVTAVKAGSVWRFVFASAQDAEQFRRGLGAHRQIGTRRHEGLGWFAVDPAWIREKPPARRIVNFDDKPPSPERQPNAWPGAEDATRAGDLLQVLKNVRALVAGFDKDKREDLQAPLHELAQRARGATSDDCAGLREFWRQRTEPRPNGVVHPRWKRAQAVEPLLRPYWGGDPSRPAKSALLRFTLDALLVLTGTNREES